MRPIAVAALVCLTLGCASAQDAPVLRPCEDLLGASIGMGDGSEMSRLFLSHAAEHVTQGVAAIGIVSRSPESATGNSYASVFLTIEPTDFTDRALVFDAASSTPDLSEALYVRGYDDNNDIVMSWQSWDGRLATGAQQFALIPDMDSGGLVWEPNRIEDDDRSEVVRLEFITGAHDPGVVFNMTVDNIRVAPATQ
jgi:hypothetical protein